MLSPKTTAKHHHTVPDTDWVHPTTITSTPPKVAENSKVSILEEHPDDKISSDKSVTSSGIQVDVKMSSILPKNHDLITEVVDDENNVSDCLLVL